MNSTKLIQMKLFVFFSLAVVSAFYQQTSNNLYHRKVVRLSLQSDSTDDVVSIARSFVSSGFGLKNPSLLDDGFSYRFRSMKFNKSQYLSGFSREVSSFQRAAPDFDYRSYGYAIDEKDSSTVLFKIRPVGTLTGPFSFKGEIYLPNQKKFELPIQQFSVKVKDSKIASLSSGAVIDKLSGNTGGLAGPNGFLYILDEKPNEFTYTPPAVVLKKFFGRKRKVPVSFSQISPFPSSVMFALASKVVDSSLGASEPSLLSDDFLFSTPLVGPLPKDEFLSYVNQYNVNAALPDLSTKIYNLEVDVYEADRVWLIVERKGTFTSDLIQNGKVVAKANGKEYRSAPEVVSVSINDQGLCYKVTSGYVLDKSLGNTAGLGGNEGLLEAIGYSLPFWETRSYGDLIENTFGRLANLLPKGSEAEIKPKASLPHVPKPDTPPSVIKSTASPVTVAPKVAPAPVVKAVPVIVPSVSPKQVASVKTELPTKSASTKATTTTTTTKAANSNPFSFFSSLKPQVIKSNTTAPAAVKSSKPETASKLTAAISTKLSTPPPSATQKTQPVKATTSTSTPASNSNNPFSFFSAPKAQATKSNSTAAAVVVKQATPAVVPKAVTPVVASKKAPPTVAETKAQPTAKAQSTSSSTSGSSPFGYLFSASKTAPVKLNETAAVSTATVKPVSAAVPKTQPIKPTTTSSSSPFGYLFLDSKPVVEKPTANTSVTPKPSPAPVGVKTASPVTPKTVEFKTTPASNTSPSSTVLNDGTSLKASSADISTIDSTLLSFLDGSIAAESVYKELIATLGSKDAAFSIFPEVIGSLPKGDKKSILNRYYQQQAN